MGCRKYRKGDYNGPTGTVNRDTNSSRLMPI
jgi:hypothetical protein